MLVVQWLAGRLAERILACQTMQCAQQRVQTKGLVAAILGRSVVAAVRVGSEGADMVSNDEDGGGGGRIASLTVRLSV